MAVEELVRLSEVARELGLSQWTLLRWAKERRLGARKLPGGYWRFSHQAVEEFKRGENTEGGQMG